MFLKFILICLVISIQKSSAFYRAFDRAIPEETTENLKGLEGLLKGLKNVTIGQLCSVPCKDEKEIPEFICDFCKFMPESVKNSTFTLGEFCPIIATSEQCRNPPPGIPNSQKEFCEFCKSISDPEPSIVPSSSSESPLNGSENTSILGADEVKDSKHRCRYVWCCDGKHVCYEQRDRSEDPKHTCWKVWCCGHIQNCHRKSGDDKFANILEEMGFQKVDGQDKVKENEAENLQEKVDNANKINAKFFNAKAKL